MKETVVALVEPNPTVVSICVFEAILSTILVAVTLASSVNVIWSPIFNSVEKRVPLPKTVSRATASSPIELPPPSVFVSVTILSPAFVDEPSVPSKSTLPDNTSEPVEIVPVSVTLSPNVESNDAFAV